MLPYQRFQNQRQKNQRQLDQQGTTSQSSLDILKGKPFWLWGDKEKHKEQYIKSKWNCCANHIWGLPLKNGKEMPIFDYQKIIFDSIEQNQNIFIKKARGIGVTTLVIRYLVWKILSTNEVDGKSIFIVSGTREEFANYVKKKMEDLFLPKIP